MHLRDICSIQTISCKRDETVQGAVHLMRKHPVGDLVVVDGPDTAPIPFGIPATATWSLRSLRWGSIRPV